MRKLFIALAALSIAGCASYANTSVTPNENAATPAEATRPATPADQILVTKDDITDRAYESLGDIEVTVRKTTIFNADPTPALVDDELREAAAKLGADAVILARYGTVGIDFLSWGKLDGRGRAVRFVE